MRTSKKNTLYIGITQIPSPLFVKWANVEKTILASPYTPGQRGKKVPQAILASLYTTPLRGNALMETKRGFLSSVCLMFEIILIRRYQCGSRLLANASQQVGLIVFLSELSQILMLRIFLRKMFQQAGLLNQLRAMLGVLRDEGSGICR